MSDTLQQIQKTYRTYRLAVLGIIVILAVAAGLVFVDRLLVLAALGIALVYHLLLVRPFQKKYSDEICTENLRRTVCRVLGCDDIAPKGGSLITAETVASARMMPSGDGKNLPLFRWEVHGERKGIRLSLCDATIPQPFALVEHGKKRVHFNSGVWAHITLPSDTQLHMKLLDDTSVPAPIRTDFFSQSLNYENASLDNSQLAEKFVFYRPRGTELQPDETFSQRLKALSDYTPGYVAVNLSGSRMDVFIRGRFLTRPVSIKEKPTEALLNFDPFPELDYIISLARAAQN